MNKILVRLAGDGGDLEVLNTSLLLAKTFGAHLACLFVMPRPGSVLFDASPVAALGAMFGKHPISELDEPYREQAAAAQITFEAFCLRESVPIVDGPPGLGGVSAGWYEVTGQRELIGVATLSDLVVETGIWTDSHVGSDTLAHLLADGGRPVILPHAADPGAMLQTVAVAWDNTLQASRALMAALPVLRKAGKIVVLHVSEGEDGNVGEARVRDYLGWADLKAEFYRLQAGGHSAAQTVLDAALEHRAGLLVMGGYGHSQASEAFFGGFTHDILNQGQLSLFLFH